MPSVIYAELLIQALYAECHYSEFRCAECRYTECPILFIVMLSDIMLNAIMLSVVMLSVIAPGWSLPEPCLACIYLTRAKVTNTLAYSGMDLVLAVKRFY